VRSLPLAFALVLRAASPVTAEGWPPGWLLGGQTTVVWQHLFPFRSPYQGPNSLRPGPDDAVSHSYTLYTGVRPVSWLELYVDPEMIRGGGLSDALGLAGFTNGEVIRNPTIGQDPYLARAFARITVPFSDETEPVDASLFQVPGARPVRRLTLTGGVLGTTDIFETNRYANSTRTQFLNWALINDAAYDFAADTRGYSRGVAIEWADRDWAVRAGSFQMPTVANGEDLDGDLLHSHGDQLEIEVQETLLPDRPTVLRALGFENRARMGDYRDAIALAERTGTIPDITRTRRRNAVKYGFALNLEQPLTPDGATGVFARLGANDGATESFCYTEAERNVSAGAQLGGALWGRTDDRFSLAMAANGLGAAHAAYLRRGGLGFLLGDGRLSYRPETILETYYAWRVVPWVTLTADYQLVIDPGYNADRGPVSVVSLRAHLEAFTGSVGRD